MNVDIEKKITVRLTFTKQEFQALYTKMFAYMKQDHEFWLTKSPSDEVEQLMHNMSKITDELNTLKYKD